MLQADLDGLFVWEGWWYMEFGPSGYGGMLVAAAGDMAWCDLCDWILGVVPGMGCLWVDEYGGLS